MARQPHIHRERGYALLRNTTKNNMEISRELGVVESTVRHWRRDVLAAEKALIKQVMPKKASPKKAKPTSATSYLAKQLEIVAKMIRAKLPELAAFSLKTTDDGKASVEYAVRQTTLVTGSVKL
jgi:hypothetical protein